MSNNYEQPVEPMSRAEDILRGDTTNVPQSRVEDLLIQLIEQGGGSSGVIVTPILEAGVKIASISVNGSVIDIYAPNDTVGSIVSISTIQQTGTKIATLTIDNTDYDIYAPAGGSSNLYGTTAPTSEQGSNGDIYIQYTPEGAPVIDEDYTSSVWTGRIFVDSSTEAEITGFDMSGCYYLRVVISDTMDNTISDIPVNEIGVYGENEPYDLQTYRGCFLEKSADGKKLYLGQTGSNQSLISRIDVRRYTQAQTAITDIYGKVENKWVGFPNKGYSETVLWHDDNGLSFNGNNQQIIQLSDDVNNYDALAIEYACSTQVSFGHALCFVLVSTIDKTGVLSFWGNPDSSDIRSAPYSYYVDDTHIRLNMTTAQVTDVAYKVIGIKYGTGGGSGSSGLNYSTDEQIIGTWIDGKPLYQKTFEYDVTNQAATGSFDITSDFPITCNVRNCVCEYEYDYQGTHYLLTNAPTNYFNRTGDVNAIIFAMGSGTTSGNLTVTAQYTKATD